MDKQSVTLSMELAKTQCYEFEGLEDNYSLTISPQGCRINTRKFNTRGTLASSQTSCGVCFNFVRHAFISPHGHLLNTADIYVLVCLNMLISGQLLCHDQPIMSCDTTETAPKNFFSLF